MNDLEKPAVPRRLFVLPQHLELRDRYHESLVDESLRLAAPQRWGLAHLAVDPKGLPRGILRVTEFVARFPSGELATRAASARPLEIGVAPSVLAEGPRDVWLGLADWSLDGPNASAEAGVATRYVRRQVPGQKERPILRPRVRLYLDGAGPLPDDRLRIARIRAAGDGIDLDAAIVPPMLWPLAATFLPGAVARVLRALQDRQSELLAAREARPHEPLTFRAEQAPQVIALSVLNQAIASLLSPTSDRGVPPWEIHRVLSELLGAIDAMEGRTDSLPTYDHASPGPGFRLLVDRALESIPTFARPPHDAFSFVRRDAHTFDLRLPEVALLRRSLYLVVSGSDRGALEQGVPAYAKLASDVWIERIRQTAVRGVELAPDFDPPGSVPSSAHSACFRMNTRSEHWADVAERRSLVLYLPGAAPNLQATLYVMRRPSPG